MVGQNFYLVLETKGDNKLCEVYTSHSVHWTTPNER